MTPGVVRPIPDDQNLERQIERQMGCMAGFLQLFDRHQMLAGKRIYAAKPLRPGVPVAGSTSPSERSEASVVSFLKEPPEPCPSSPETHVALAAESPARPTPLPVFDFRSSWKLREAPRLSLDSRLRPRDIRTQSAAGSDPTVEDLDRHRRSPSVVARLMGLDALPDSGGGGGAQDPPLKPAVLRRSASESRVPRDPSYYRFVEDELAAAVARKRDAPPAPVAGPLRSKKSFFDAQDYYFVPEPKRAVGSLYGEIERRLRMRGIDEPAKDLETLKQILEALQLKGLLHSKIDDRRPPMRSSVDAPIVVMKPAPRPVRRRSESPPLLPFRSGSGPARNRVSEPVPRRRPRSPDASPPPRRRPVNAEAKPQPRTPAGQTSHSPRTSQRRVVPDSPTVRSPRNRGRVFPPAEDDTATTISGSSISSSSLLDFERSRAEYYGGAGRSLLERCDKLLHSIEAFTSAEQTTGGDQQPSPVSVLDSSSFLGDESSPSPVTTKRSILFEKDQLLGAEWAAAEEQCDPATPTVGSRSDDDDADYAYVADILRSSGRGADVYAMLEKRARATGPTARLHRRLVFDTVAEIVERKRHAAPWHASSLGPASGWTMVRHVWGEVRRIRERVPTDDLDDVTCGAIRKDMAGGGDRGWDGGETSDAVLQIERLIFKDLVAETIRELADRQPGPGPLPRRKLLF